jgi:hypothetical protein
MEKATPSGAGLPQDDLCLLILPVCDRVIQAPCLVNDQCHQLHVCSISKHMQRQKAEQLKNSNFPTTCPGYPGFVILPPASTLMLLFGNHISANFAKKLKWTFSTICSLPK